MRRLLLLLAAVLTAFLAAALIARAGATATPGTQFRTPDAGAACRLEHAVLVCSNLGSAGSVALGASGTPAATHELPWWDASTPVLHTWRHGAISCRLDGATIVCRNPHGAIVVARDGFAVAG